MAIICVSGENRRGKSLLFLIGCALAGFLPHCIGSPKGFIPALVIACLLGFYGLIVVLKVPKSPKDCLNFFLAKKEIENNLPSVDVLVSARDEENVVFRLVHRLLSLKYPKEKIKICIIDDGSQDDTPLILQELNKQFSNLKILSRARSSGGGKSGALNYALREVNGDWVFILDADADFDDETLLKLVPFAQNGELCAVQLRKAVVNSQKNLLTSCQAMEMAMDTCIQQGRQELGGVVELRGNGVLLNRSILDKCGGFNENTITDDLDLSFRLLIEAASVGILWYPPVQEEAVETISSLFIQRKRWAEGGLQRFFDYWPFLISNRLNIIQHVDLTVFFLLQYALPVVSIVDILTAIYTKTVPVYWPLSLIAFSISGLAYYRGCNILRQNQIGPKIPSPNIFNLFCAIIYLSHWFIVIPLITIKMACMPKKLKWAKTIHKG